ncbi:hypothetical protein AB0O90_16955 [Microbacterium testaceum]|uniref:hypothetical protein n=1 Tax=Microbacterium testaceum TaxID=2033 RepID=UPI003428D113
MKDVWGWATVAVVLCVPFVFAAVAYAVGRRQRRAGASPVSSGGLLGFDELFHPAAHDARIVWEAEQEIPLPAPTPDRGPGVIEAGGRITIEVAAEFPEERRNPNT